MEVCSPCNTTDRISSCKSGGSLHDPSSQSQHNSGALCMNELKACLTGLQFNEGFMLSAASSGKDKTNEKLINIGESETKHENHHSEKYLCKSATFPQSSGLKSTGLVSYCDEEEHEHGKVSEIHGLGVLPKDFDQPCSRSLSLPASLNIVSAMKGSREKQGVTSKKLTVTWAPDVYDPIPTSVSHIPSSKPQRYGKKSRKNKQRSSSKSSRSNGKSKDKKWKNNSRSYMVKPFQEERGVVVSSKEMMLEAQLHSAEMVF